MPKIYSMDIRNLAIKKVLSGERQYVVAQSLDIGLNTLERWLRSYREHGHAKPMTRDSYHRKICRETLKQRIAQQPDITLQLLADECDSHPSVIDYHLRKMKITRKKNHAVSRAGRGKKA